MVGMERVDDAHRALENLPDAEVEVCYLPQIQYIHRHDFGCRTVSVEKAVTQNLGAGVNTED